MTNDLLLPAPRSAASNSPTAQQVTARQLSTVAALCLIEARPAVQAMVVLRFTAAVLLGTGPVVPDRQVICGCAAMVLISTCVYLVNGITDLAGDVANGSTRPLARGLLTAGQARAGACASGTGGMLLAVWAGPFITGCAAAMAVAGMGYSCGQRPWKNRPRAASTSIGVLGAAAYLAGCASAGWLDCPSALLLGATMTLWMSLVGARTKDFSDLTGDRLAGRLTLVGGAAEPMLRRRTAASAITIAIGFLLLTSRYAHQLFWSATGLLLMAGAVAVLALRGSSVGSRALTRRPYRAFMSGQYAANVLAIVGAVI